jgi:hypothetical protein
MRKHGNLPSSHMYPNILTMLLRTIMIHQRRRLRRHPKVIRLRIRLETMRRIQV